MTKKKILVVCGAGVATSTVVTKKLEEKLGERGVPVQVDQCKVTEVPYKAADYDLIVTTTLLGEVQGTPVVQTLSFLTGVGLEADLDRIVGILGEA
jgi:PTS system galactitol-specific IIB component